MPGSSPGSAIAPAGLVASAVWWLLPAVALVALPGRRLRRWLSGRSVLAAACAALLVAVSIQAAPHLAHHALDTDGDDSCAWFALASHGEGVAPEIQVLGVPASVPTALPGSACPASAAPRPTDHERAPPA